MKAKLKIAKKEDFSRLTKLVSVSKMRRYDFKLNLKKEKKDLLSKMLCHPTHIFRVQKTKQKQRGGPAIR